MDDFQSLLDYKVIKLMSNNNNKPGYQQSPNKYQQQHYSRPEQKERSYQERRNDFQPYPIQYSDPNQGNRNAL